MLAIAILAIGISVPHVRLDTKDLGAYYIAADDFEMGPAEVPVRLSWSYRYQAWHTFTPANMPEWDRYGPTMRGQFRGKAGDKVKVGYSSRMGRSVIIGVERQEPKQ